MPKDKRIHKNFLSDSELKVIRLTAQLTDIEYDVRQMKESLKRIENEIKEMQQ